MMENTTMKRISTFDGWLTECNDIALVLFGKYYAKRNHLNGLSIGRVSADEAYSEFYAHTAPRTAVMVAFVG